MDVSELENQNDDIPQAAEVCRTSELLAQSKTADVRLTENSRRTAVSCLGRGENAVFATPIVKRIFSGDAVRTIKYASARVNSRHR